jgi:hypothetical protein
VLGIIELLLLRREVSEPPFIVGTIDRCGSGSWRMPLEESGDGRFPEIAERNEELVGTFERGRERLVPSPAEIEEPCPARHTPRVAAFLAFCIASANHSTVW